jgi:hypothetical protein
MDDLDLLAARFSLGQIHEDDLISAAVEALASGLDGQALRELAGVIPVERDQIRPLFVQSMQELGRGLPDVPQAVRILTRHIATEALEGHRDLMDASCELGGLGLSLGLEDRSLAIWPGSEVNLYVFDEICDSQGWAPPDRWPEAERTARIREEMGKILQAS